MGAALQLVAQVAIAGQHKHRRGMRGQHLRPRFKQVGQPFLIHQPAHRQHQRRAGRQAQLGAHCRARARVGLKGGHIDAIRDDAGACGGRAQAQRAVAQIAAARGDRASRAVGRCGSERKRRGALGQVDIRAVHAHHQRQPAQTRHQRGRRAVWNHPVAVNQVEARAGAELQHCQHARAHRQRRGRQHRALQPDIGLQRLSIAPDVQRTRGAVAKEV